MSHWRETLLNYVKTCHERKRGFDMVTFNTSFCRLLGIAHGLRNEMHFCDEKSSQARPMLQLFADHRTENISALWMWKCCEEHFQAK
jgi:hypothetical protein